MTEAHNDRDDSFSGSKRTDRLVIAALLASLGGGAVSVTKDTSDRYKSEDARRDKSELRAEILQAESAARLGDVTLRSEMSQLQEAVRSHHIEAGKYDERINRNTDDIDELAEEIKELKRRGN